MKAKMMFFIAALAFSAMLFTGTGKEQGTMIKNSDVACELNVPVQLPLPMKPAKTS